VKSKYVLTITGSLAALGVLFGIAFAAQDKYTLKVPGGLAFSEFRGYEGWQTVAISRNGALFDVILGNSTMIDAYKAGIPDNGKPFPDGAKMAKIHWVPKTNDTQPGPPTVPGVLHDVDFMLKDGNRFADSGGWGWAVFEYDTTSGNFRPGNMTDRPPQGHNAQCGFECHTKAKDRDYVFTEYAKR
jgi:hypothetical protein